MSETQGEGRWVEAFEAKAVVRMAAEDFRNAAADGTHLAPPSAFGVVSLLPFRNPSAQQFHLDSHWLADYFEYGVILESFNSSKFLITTPKIHAAFLGGTRYCPSVQQT